MELNQRKNRNFCMVKNDFIDWYGKILGPIGIAIYVCLKRHADIHTSECFPSQELIAKKIGVDVRSVKRYLRRLKVLGLIEVIKEKNTGRWPRNRYIVHDPNKLLTDRIKVLSKQGTLSPLVKDLHTLIQRTQSPINKTHYNNTDKNKTDIDEMRKKLTQYFTKDIIKQPRTP